VAQLSRLSFDRVGRDFIINGKPLLRHLETHELIDPSMYQPSIGVQPLAAERLCGSAEPDLVAGHVALYVCGMCGDYDGSPIGVRLNFDDHGLVCWDDLGIHDDVVGWSPFKVVRGYRFAREDYLAALRAAASSSIVE
jgi:hypothetical protein